MKTLGVVLTLLALGIVGTLIFEAPTQAASGNPVVTVGNVPLPSRDVDNPARRPFQTTLCRGYGSAELCGTTPHSYSVPNNSRLVIEFVSGTCPPAGTSLPTGLNVTGALLQTVAGGTAATHLFAVSPGLSIGGLNGVAVSQQTRIYADPGTTVTLSADVGGLGVSGSMTCTLAISGHTVTP